MNFQLAMKAASTGAIRIDDQDSVREEKTLSAESGEGGG